MIRLFNDLNLGGFANKEPMTIDGVESVTGARRIGPIINRYAGIVLNNTVHYMEAPAVFHEYRCSVVPVVQEDLQMAHTAACGHLPIQQSLRR
jgi:hypothetical protein